MVTDVQSPCQEECGRADTDTGEWQRKMADKWELDVVVQATREAEAE